MKVAIVLLMTSYMFELYLLILFVWECAGVARAGVAIVGTTVAPNFARPEYKRSDACPTSHKFSIARGNFCCSYGFKPDDVAIHADCDGSAFNVYDSELCCDDAARIQCPHKDTLCKDNADIKQDGGWSEWGPWTVEAARDYTSTEQTDADAMAKGDCLVATNWPHGTLTYCHLEDIVDVQAGGTWTWGVFGYWDDKSEEGPAFMKLNYTDGSSDKWTSVEFVCDNTNWAEYITHYDSFFQWSAHKLKIHHKSACNRVSVIKECY